MIHDTFPFWPPSSPQEPGTIPGLGVRIALEDLINNQAPRGRSDEIPLIMQLIPRIRPPEYPATPENREAGFYGQSLLDYFMATEAMPRDQMFRAVMNSR